MAVEPALTSESSAPSRMRQVRAWDLPTRLFKWSLVALVASSWLTRWYGDVTLTWHKRTGYAILILVVFRLLWGLVGSSTAKFNAWISWPWDAIRYGVDLVRGRSRPYLGHNPLGAWMILALLGLVGSQAVAGLFTADSNGIFGGPFANYDPFSDPTPLQRLLSRYHHRAFDLLLVFVAVHVGVNLFYQFVKRDPIVAAMITGCKPVEPFADQAEMTPAPRQALRALACLVLAAALVLGTIKAFGGSLT